MLLRWLFKMLTRAATIGFVCYLMWLGWTHFRPHKPEVSSQRKEIADAVIPQVVEDLRVARQSLQTSAMLHLVNDSSDYVTEQLRSAIEHAGIVDLQDRSLMEKARDLLSLRHPSYGDIDAALIEAKRRGVETVVFGKINAFEAMPDGAKIDFDIQLASVQQGRVLLNRNYERSTGRLSQGAVQEQLQSAGPIKCFLGWAAIVVLLPVFSISYIRFMVRRTSNRINAYTLILYTAVDAIFAYLLVGANLMDWSSVGMFVFAVGLAAAYNLYIMSYALKLEE